MNALELVETLLTLPTVAAQRTFLDNHVHFVNDEVVRLLDQKAAHFLRVDLHLSIQIADHLYYIGELTDNPLYKAQGLVLQADARSIGLGQYERAIALYDEAAEIYGLAGYIPRQAWAQIGKVNALSYIGRYTEALEIGTRIIPILKAEGWQRSVAVLTMNLGIVHGRQGEDMESLDMFDQAGKIYEQMGKEGKTDWALIQQNRAVALRNLGRFAESIEASRMASQTLDQLEERVEAARARQGLALTYFVLGRFNEALQILDRVQDVFLDDGRLRDAMLVELYTTDCLLQLRRFPEVIEKSSSARKLFAAIGTNQLAALALVNEAVAYAELRRFGEALSSFDEARRLFEEAGNDVRTASTDLERSAVFLCQGELIPALKVAENCVTIFKTKHLPTEQAQALIVAARACLGLNDYEQAQQFLAEALQIGEARNIPTVRYQAHSLLGTLARLHGDGDTAQTQWEDAIAEIEQLRGRLMVEFRVSFLEDKETLYENMVDLCIERGQPGLGLEFAERAKSRALLDLLAYRLNVTPQPHGPGDRPLLEELKQLRTVRDELYRRWESDAESDENNERAWSSSQALRQKAQQDVLTLEKQITHLWHRLLVRNADYAREAALWIIRTESVQPYLDADTLLVEYYVVHDRLLAFLVTASDVRTMYLDADLQQIQTLLQRFQLNLRAVSRSTPRQITGFIRNAQALLFRLYELVIKPLEEHLSAFTKLVIVPHGPLHYVPFHAVYDGASYLLERHEISYLPNASSLRYCLETRAPTSRGLALGHSNNGRLPHAVEEAGEIATLLGCQELTEEAATLAEFNRLAPECAALHLATHGEFRADNPLFSGLIFADGWLTTMDIFNLRLNASLVTLSACHTGQNVPGGGDELLGLMRAFLGAGAASVALTLWAVEDRSTAQLMGMFYRKLIEGYSKSQAIRRAQIHFIHRSSDQSAKPPEHYAHPYFWAPFFLVGDPGPL